MTVKKICNKKVAYITIVSLAACYQWIYCIQECSEYAIMLFFLFGALWLYVECNEKFAYWKMFGFILACIGAIYSQYGSVFVAVPLLVLFYIGIIFSHERSIFDKIVLSISYIFSYLYFARHLYLFYVQKQLENNKISENQIKISIGLFKNIFNELGNIIGYFFNINQWKAGVLISGLFTLVLIGTSLYLFIKKKLNWTKQSLLIILWICYLMHYILSQLHIYGMVHSGQSLGFESRYSYFYIPLLSIVLPIIFYEMSKEISQGKAVIIWNGIKIIGIICILISFVTLLGNWYKAKDNVYANIWPDHNGWEDTTYLLGMADHGFKYYVTHSDQYKEGYLDNTETEVDLNDLPKQFWVWRTNWGGENWERVIKRAKKEGYTVIVYDDSGYVGQLAYCKYDK